MAPGVVFTAENLHCYRLWIPCRSSSLRAERPRCRATPSCRRRSASQAASSAGDVLPARCHNLGVVTRCTYHGPASGTGRGGVLHWSPLGAPGLMGTPVLSQEARITCGSLSASFIESPSCHGVPGHPLFSGSQTEEVCSVAALSQTKLPESDPEPSAEVSRGSCSRDLCPFGTGPGQILA